jgi:hypothetical protein
MEEVWKPCYKQYEVSNLGNCRRRNKNAKRYGEYKLVAGSVSKTCKYKYIQEGRKHRINHLIHIWVAEQFLEPKPQPDFMCDHINRNKLDNRAENLRWVSRSENYKNSSQYRHDILEQDPIIRHRIIDKEYRERKKISSLGENKISA